jgi:hypothetical protein
VTQFQIRGTQDKLEGSAWIAARAVQGENNVLNRDVCVMILEAFFEGILLLESWVDFEGDRTVDSLSSATLRSFQHEEPTGMA